MLENTLFIYLLISMTITIYNIIIAAHVIKQNDTCIGQSESNSD